MAEKIQYDFGKISGKLCLKCLRLFKTKLMMADKPIFGLVNNIEHGVIKENINKLPSVKTCIWILLADCLFKINTLIVLVMKGKFNDINTRIIILFIYMIYL